jgi:ketosteroid isomerase-like protein
MSLRRAALALAVAVSAPTIAAPDLAELQRQVWDTEVAFARTMADRDHAAFARFLSEAAVFLGGQQVLQGKAAVAAGWKAFYDGAQAPFSWGPDHVVVLADGTLAHSTGLVRDPAGKVIGRFNSVWRLEAPNTWRVVFDKGSPLTEGEKKLNEGR